MKLEEFDYNLNESLIAHIPLENRENSRMMILNKNTNEIKDDVFKNILNYFKKDDVLVLNETRVIPARLIGNRKNKEEKIEILLLKKIKLDEWECLGKPGKKIKKGTEIVFGDNLLLGEIQDILPSGNRIIKFFYEGVFENLLEILGEMPLPPYINEKLEDKSRYQTIYAKNDGSSAAPTAGLHFTENIIEKIKAKGVKIAYLTLHVGLGTFRPVKVKNIEDHEMHSEFFSIDKCNADIIDFAMSNKKNIYCVGTTSCRTLESIFLKYNKIQESSGDTDIFIYPGFKFNVINGLITNFHLPKSTLLMLISAFSDKETIFKAYDIAQNLKYRFFSFGDCMFIKGDINGI